MRLVRAALLLLLALSLTLQPVLAAVGELHELQAHAETAALHSDVATDHHDARSGSSADDEAAPGEQGSDALHTLLHFAHCCGHSASLVPPGSGVNWSSLPDVAPDGNTGVVAVDTRRCAPFRPPIAR